LEGPCGPKALLPGAPGACPRECHVLRPLFGTCGTGGCVAWERVWEKWFGCVEGLGSQCPLVVGSWFGLCGCGAVRWKPAEGTGR